MDLESTVQALAPRLLAYCLGCTGCRALAEDVAQEALVALVQRWRRHGRPDSPEAFTFAIARRRAYRVLLRRRLIEPLDALLDNRTGEPDPEMQTTGREELAIALRAIRGLSRNDREALLLAAVAEIDGPVAARLLGLSEPAFRMRVHRARSRLKIVMEGSDER